MMHAYRDLIVRLFSYDAFVLVKGDAIEADKEYDFEDKVLGMYYVKPNYPGRCSHVSLLIYQFVCVCMC